MAEGRTAFALADDDWYVEPEWCTDYLLDREELPQLIWDPSCGQGNILRRCQARGYMVCGSDTVARGEPRFPWEKRDFLTETVPDLGGHPWALVCNPPYGGAKTAEAFIRKGLRLEGLVKMCMFLNSKFLFGKGRARGLFADHPPSTVYPINPRPSCPPGQFLLDGGKASGGVENFCWIVWEPDFSGQARIVWR